jgi:hypothetical protein
MGTGVRRDGQRQLRFGTSCRPVTPGEADEAGGEPGPALQDQQVSGAVSLF